ncbi:hypothetical protein MJG53_006372 [Ovis ammon polii x Ovis aries]|uniref:Uncharacterized protein n=1 Tax=Ovis ammon polii x Ovis aries TaxID=2918886 RepID=A0ACB9V4U3_9CETA|nr:hypothetical protein MJG53_006372 [Ovis ammon polii x Ovis aries]
MRAVRRLLQSTLSLTGPASLDLSGISTYLQSGTKLLLRKAGNGVYCDQDAKPRNQQVQDLESLKTELNLSHLHGIPQTDLYFCPLSFEKELTRHGAGDKAYVRGETVSKWLELLLGDKHHTYFIWFKIFNQRHNEVSHLPRSPGPLDGDFTLITLMNMLLTHANSGSTDIEMGGAQAPPRLRFNSQESSHLNQRR